MLLCESPEDKDRVATAVRTVLAKERAKRPPRVGKGKFNERRYAQIPVDIIMSTCQVTGRNKYRAIVAMVWLSMYWDGWKSKNKRKNRKSARAPRNESMVTRRMMADVFGYSERTFGSALRDLLENNITSIARESVFNGKGKPNLGRAYKCPWMADAKDKKRSWVYWGLLVSEKFLNLEITTQAILLILHTFHVRNANYLVIDYKGLTVMGISRRIINHHVDVLRYSGLLIYMGEKTYQFAWVQKGGCYNDGWEK